MILVIDVGNTQTVLGVYREDVLVHHWRVASDREKTSDEYGILLGSLLASQGLSKNDIRAVALSSVVPPLVRTLVEMSRDYLGVSPLVVNWQTQTGLEICYDNPREVGADRVVNAVAAVHHYGGPVVVVDFGTATTFCAIDGNGRYLGGAIAPGVGIAIEALFQRAAKLPRIELTRPASVLGKNTVESMQSGVIFGAVGQVDGIVKRILAELGWADVPVIATGGLGEWIGSECETVTVVDPLLTLRGLYLIYQRNQG